MTTLTTRVRLTVCVAIVLSVTGCASGGDGETKAGGASPPVVLRIGTADRSGRLSALAIDEFARQVDARGDGTIKIEPVYQANGDDETDDWDQHVARMVVSGELEMGMIPARAWDTEGVTSLRALQAPLLVDSDELVDEIVTSELAGEMLAGLDGIGVTGLQLLPESLRHVFAFGSPMVVPDDFVGVTIRSPMSATSYALFEALGAKPDDMVDEMDEGTGATEAPFPFAASHNPATESTTGNVVFFPKLETLVANTDVFGDLTEDQRGVLRAAAAATLEWSRGEVTSDEVLATQYCQSDRGSVVLASEAELARLEQAVAPVYAELERDAQTKSLIERIEAMKTALPPAVAITACEASATPEEAVVADEPAPDIDGVYRYEVTVAMYEARGLEPDLLGVHTVTFDAGVFVDESPDGTCVGTYSASGDRFTLRWTEGCFGDLSVTLTVVGNELHWSDVESLPPFTDAETHAYNEAFTAVPWTRIADVE